MKTIALLLSLLALPAMAQTITPPAPPKAHPAKQAAQGNPLGASHNSKSPIAIDSDTLEVLQNQNKAVFSGNVLATQDTMTLRGDRMTVYYRNNGGAPEEQKPAKQKPKPEAASASGVSRIDVNGHVFITSPEETARGDNGIYDVDKKMIYLTGDVILTKGKNVLKGNSAEYNVATGRSLMVGAQATGTPGSLPAHSGRVRGLFIPQDDNAKPAANTNAVKVK
jgi:lipopolysaccharide export system protein LptA